MYVPASFAEPDISAVHDFMRRNSFAVLNSSGKSGLIASHLPLILDPEAGPRGSLLGHMARANSHWNEIEGEVMVVFSGPHAYISPSWYEEPATVPTWNYVAVHAYGQFVRVDDRDWLIEILHRSVETYESSRPQPWTFDDASPHVDAMLKAIVGFRVEITRLEGKWKLSQNHSTARRERVIAALSDQPGENPQAIAALMRASMRPGK